MYPLVKQWGAHSHSRIILCVCVPLVKQWGTYLQSQFLSCVCVPLVKQWETLWHSQFLLCVCVPLVKQWETLWHALLRYSLESPANRPKLKFCKQILGLKRNSSSLAVYGELGIIPTALFAIIRTIKFWHRVSHQNDTVLVKRRSLSQSPSQAVYLIGSVQLNGH